MFANHLVPIAQICPEMDALELMGEIAQLGPNDDIKVDWDEHNLGLEIIVLSYNFIKVCVQPWE